MKITIALGTDHRGFMLKEFLKQQAAIGDFVITWLDCGACDAERSDYPVFAQLVVENVITEQANLGVLLCGSGIGMSIAANRFDGIYAGLVWNPEIARLAREDDNCNVLVLPADFCDEALALAMLHAWIHAEFKQGMYAQRLKLIDD